MKVVCETCEGTGLEEIYCSYCAGSGEGPADGTTCSVCKGTGTETISCEDCGGSGEYEEEDDDES